jgi:hypothetical protein
MADYAMLLRDHVMLTCRSVDRIFLQAYVPRLQSGGMVCQFLRWQRGYPIPSSAAFGKIGQAYVTEVHRADSTGRRNTSIWRCMDGTAKRMGSSCGGKAADAVTGSPAGGRARTPAAVLGGDRQGNDE